MWQVRLWELTVFSLCCLRLQQLCSHFLLMPTQMKVCVATVAQRWSSPLERATLGAWSSVSPGRSIKQTPSSSSTTLQTKTCSTMHQLVILHIIKPNKKRPHNDINMFSLSHTDVKTSAVTPLITGIGLETCYSCKSNDVIENKLVNQTLWNVLIQAFITSSTKSDKCKCVLADANIISPL